MTTTDLPQYTVHALRFARMPRPRRHNFMYLEDHDGPMPLDFFVWLIQGPGTTVLVDTGFGARSAASRKRELDHCPIEALGALGVAPADITDAILTHLHWDHAGNLDKLPAARIHIQDAEVEYATGRCMCEPYLRRAYSVDDVCDLVRRVYEDRVQFHAGDWTLKPGIEGVFVGGHTRGLQAVRVHTARGWIVLASDAAHYYANIEQNNPFPIAADVAAMLAGYRKLMALADSPDHFIPGHDPLVLERYPLVEGAGLKIACVSSDCVSRAVGERAPI
ncbi:N-acyl homoserine lactonase family protein [Paraburkholderia unamae]|uniref:Glyoxylase-like metal-dependent hydrolase (Beta-lactamase superfamily II) n=1 Tax=Paraburkholderia unamae TaxID=219649 RepID=A0ABX5KE34_9BURK|nr:N-acyl homoserine lactonase family protein [Paraburkholderia unamae]PVX75717.1 glyoxylase-like metal-dependent hydrolase (beta-lactamase superfamily II) [Paraburkholderia unamae]